VASVNFNLLGFSASFEASWNFSGVTAKLFGYRYSMDSICRKTRQKQIQYCAQVVHWRRESKWANKNLDLFGPMDRGEKTDAPSLN